MLNKNSKHLSDSSLLEKICQLALANQRKEDQYLDLSNELESRFFYHYENDSHSTSLRRQSNLQERHH